MQAGSGSWGSIWRGEGGSPRREKLRAPVDIWEPPPPEREGRNGPDPEPEPLPVQAQVAPEPEPEPLPVQAVEPADEERSGPSAGSIRSWLARRRRPRPAAAEVAEVAPVLPFPEPPPLGEDFIPERPADPYWYLNVTEQLSHDPDQALGVVLVSSHHETLSRVGWAVSSQPDMQILAYCPTRGQAISALQTIRGARQLFALIDLSTEGEPGPFHLIREVRDIYPIVRVIALGTGVEQPMRALFAGADGFIRDDGDDLRLVQALRRAGQGDLPMEDFESAPPPVQAAGDGGSEEPAEAASDGAGPDDARADSERTWFAEPAS